SPFPLAPKGHAVFAPPSIGGIRSSWSMLSEPSVPRLSPRVTPSSSLRPQNSLGRRRWHAVSRGPSCGSFLPSLHSRLGPLHLTATRTHATDLCARFST